MLRVAQPSYLNDKQGPNETRPLINCSNCDPTANGELPLSFENRFPWAILVDGFTRLHGGFGQGYTNLCELPARTKANGVWASYGTWSKPPNTLMATTLTVLMAIAWGSPFLPSRVLA